MKSKISRVTLAVLMLAAGAAHAQDKTLRLLTWADYVPKDVMEQFTKETGIKVEVTLSNNEEMISKLRATGGAGFDLAQPSQDRIAGPQTEFSIYKPMDLSKIKGEQFIAPMLEATRLNTTVGGKVYAVPHIWGTDGLVVNTKTSKAADYTDLCAAENAGKVSMRLKRPTLIAFAFASGKNPFAAYSDPKAYTALMEEVGKTLTECKKNVKFYWDGKDQLLAGMRSGELTTAMMWDTGGWGLNKTPTSSSSRPSPAHSAGSTPSPSRPRAATTRLPTPGSTSTCAPRSPPRSPLRLATSRPPRAVSRAWTRCSKSNSVTASPTPR